MDIQIKVRWKGESFDKWENRPVLATCHESLEQDLVHGLTKSPNIVEIRWNVAGSSQGHYLWGSAQE